MRELFMRELFMRELCVCESKLCVREMCVSKLCLRELCVMEEAGGGGGGGRRRRSGCGRECTTKNKNSHKDVGQKDQFLCFRTSVQRGIYSPLRKQRVE